MPFKEEVLPAFLRKIGDEVLRPWRENGYRTEFGDVELDSETADRAYYFDVRRGSVHFRLVTGVKESDNEITVTCNVAYYPKDTKYIILAAAVAGILTGTLFYYYVLESYVYTAFEIAVAWTLSAAGATAVNFLFIRYFRSRAKKYLRSGGRARVEALALEREVRELAHDTLIKYGDFIAG